MRILHVSDLHFGNHDKQLAEALKRKVESLNPRPDLVICTGDVADQPKVSLLREGLEHLRELVRLCTPNSAKIPLIVVPGNHDYRVFGFLQRALGLWDWVRPYNKVFRDIPHEGFFEHESGNVWVFGFDSSTLGEFGGGGKVSPDEIDRFHKRYAEMQRTPKFDGSFKIVAVHHHPLPVNRRQDFRAQFLTMMNAGDFLTAVLYRRIDLVLHGHEHIQSQSEFSSTLGDNEHRIFTSSLGATLKDGRENWFSVITIGKHEIKSDFYTNVGQEWSERPEGPAWVLRSGEMSELAAWDKQKQEVGYYYRELSSITVLDQDGDAQRSVECEDLMIERENCARAQGHRLRLPASSGSLRRLRAEGEEGLSVTVKPDKSDNDIERGQPLEATLEFSPPVHQSARYIYRWYAVNAFAMDTRQFDYQYGKDENATNDIEYTHYVVEDPIEDLTVVAQFPQKFKFGERPRVRVMKYDSKEPDSRKWPWDTAVKATLMKAHALHYYPSMNTAALRVKRPMVGLSYGIEWKVLKAESSEQTQDEVEIRSAISKVEKNMSEAAEQELLELMGYIIEITRDIFLRKPDRKYWRGPLGASIMWFNGKDSLEVVIAAYQRQPSRAIKGTEYDVKLRYGDGIAGRAFKANRPRVYVAPDPNVGDEEGPDYFVHLPGQPDFKVVVALPLHAPSGSYSPENPRAYESQRPYGVLNLDSIDESCPLRQLRNPGKMPDVLQFQHLVNVLIFKSLTRILG